MAAAQGHQGPQAPNPLNLSYNILEQRVDSLYGAGISIPVVNVSDRDELRTCLFDISAFSGLHKFGAKGVLAHFTTHTAVEEHPCYECARTGGNSCGKHKTRYILEIACSSELRHPDDFTTKCEEYARLSSYGEPEPVDFSHVTTEWRKDGGWAAPLGLRMRVQLSIVIHPDGAAHIQYVNASPLLSGNDIMDIANAILAYLGVASCHIQDKSHVGDNTALRVVLPTINKPTLYGKTGYKMKAIPGGYTREQHAQAVAWLRGVRLGDLLTGQYGVIEVAKIKAAMDEMKLAGNDLLATLLERLTTLSRQYKPDYKPPTEEQILVRFGQADKDNLVEWTPCVARGSGFESTGTRMQLPGQKAYRMLEELFGGALRRPGPNHKHNKEMLKPTVDAILANPAAYSASQQWVAHMQVMYDVQDYVKDFTSVLQPDMIQPDQQAQLQAQLKARLQAEPWPCTPALGMTRQAKRSKSRTPDSAKSAPDYFSMSYSHDYTQQGVAIPALPQTLAPEAMWDGTLPPLPPMDTSLPPLPFSYTGETGFDLAAATTPLPPLSLPPLSLPPLSLPTDPVPFPYMGELGSGVGPAGQMPAVQGADAGAVEMGQGQVGLSPQLLALLGQRAQAAAAGAAGSAQAAGSQFSFDAYAGLGGVNGMQQAPAAAAGAAGSGLGSSTLGQVLIDTLKQQLKSAQATATAVAAVQQSAGPARGRGGNLGRNGRAARDQSMAQPEPTTRRRKRDEDDGPTDTQAAGAESDGDEDKGRKDKRPRGDGAASGGRRCRARCQREQPQQLPAGFPAVSADVHMANAEQFMQGGVQGGMDMAGSEWLTWLETSNAGQNFAHQPPEAIFCDEEGLWSILNQSNSGLLPHTPPLQPQQAPASAPVPQTPAPAVNLMPSFSAAQGAQPIVPQVHGAQPVVPQLHGTQQQQPHMPPMLNLQLPAVPLMPGIQPPTGPHMPAAPAANMAGMSGLMAAAGFAAQPAPQQPVMDVLQLQPLPGMAIPAMHQLVAGAPAHFPQGTKVLNLGLD